MTQPKAAYPTWLPILLGVLTAVGPLSTDMYLPAFPAIEASLGGQPGTAQVTLSAWFIGLAVGQITQGSLSDRFGRRGPLIVGLLIYALANAGCALAPDLPTLSALRFVAAFGGSASMVIPRAIVRDLADGHAAARLMSRLMLVMGVAPILAPTLGGLVLGVAPWHAIFWLTGAYGAVCCALVWRLLPDTLAPERRIGLGPASLARRYAGVLRDRVFLSYALMGGCGMFGMFAYIGGSSPVFIQRFAFSPAAYGMLFGCSAGAFILSSQVNPWLILRFGAARVIRAGGVGLPGGGAGDGGLRLPGGRRRAGDRVAGGARDGQHGPGDAQCRGRGAVPPCRAGRQRVCHDGHLAVLPGGGQRRAGRPAHRRDGAADGVAAAARRHRHGCRGPAAA